MTAVRHHRKDLMIEARFLPENLEQAKRLREVIRTAIADGRVDGVSPNHAESMADSLTGWLVGKTQGVDGLAATTRSRYRRVLSALEAEVGPGGGERGVLGHPGIAGVLGALVGAGVAAPASPGAAAALLALVPIIYAPDTSPAPELELAAA